MKISITNYGETHSFECDHDDVSLDKVVEQIRGLLVSAGYHPANVCEYFDVEFDWNIKFDDGSLRNDDPVGGTKDQLSYPSDFAGKHDTFEPQQLSENDEPTNY